MKLSILIPVGSIHEYFLEAINSVLDDAPLESEILICATSSVIALAKSQLASQKSDKRLKFVKSEHGDIVSNLNTGLSAAIGEYIARMDSDDVVIPGRFRKQIAYLDEIRSADVLGSHLQYICPHGVNRGLQDYPSKIRRRAFGFVSPKVAHPSVMMRRKVVQSLGMYSSEYPHVEDLELWLRVLRDGEIHNINEPLLKYRLHPGQISRKKSDEQLKNSLIAFVNDARWYAKLPPINPACFSELSVEDFFSERKKLLIDLKPIVKAFFELKFQEKYLERFCLSYLHSKPPHRLVISFFSKKVDANVSAKIKKNFHGFVMILLKIIINRVKMKITKSGRTNSKIQKNSAGYCPQCF